MQTTFNSTDVKRFAQYIQDLKDQGMKPQDEAPTDGDFKNWELGEDLRRRKETTLHGVSDLFYSIWGNPELCVPYSTLTVKVVGGVHSPNRLIYFDIFKRGLDIVDRYQIDEKGGIEKMDRKHYSDGKDFFVFELSCEERSIHIEITGKEGRYAFDEYKDCMRKNICFEYSGLSVGNDDVFKIRTYQISPDETLRVH